MRWPRALVLALAVGAWAADASAQPAYTWRVQPGPAAPPPRAKVRSPDGARAVIVVGGVTLSVGIALSWTGITGLVWQATQHQTLAWAAPVSIASVPLEIVGSVLVLGGAVDLLAQRTPAVAGSDAVAVPVASARSLFSVPLLQADF